MPRQARIEIQLDRIVDRASFHAVFAEAFGFPDFYGRNMDAWVDCMQGLDAPSHGMSVIHAPEGAPLLLVLKGARSFDDRCPDLMREMLVCAGIVNGHRDSAGERAVLTIALID